MAEQGRNITRRRKKDTVSIPKTVLRPSEERDKIRVPKEPVPSNMRPTFAELDDKGRIILSRSEISRVGALGGTPNSSEATTGINISQREGDRYERSEYKMPKKKQIKPKPRPDVGAIERGDRAAKRTAQDLATQNFGEGGRIEEGGRIADVRDNPKRGQTY